ncbi:neutral zinc metallopeptidase [Ideonella sp. DXS29W]|uniref:Neutral zinc metallopeptidase n=1 Tax=Ideonella lacteola TaxID=2984193 RepID=A0ABU9BRN5_9BURK
MRWDGNRQSDNVEDRRDEGGGPGGGIALGGRGVGLGTVAVAVLAGWIFGINPLTMLGLLSGGAETAAPTAPAHAPPANDREAAFVSTVLADTEDVWTELFQQSGGSYQRPRLVLFRGSTRTACGLGQTAMGPFYCPGDQKVYIDLSFYDTLKRQLGAPGDFAQAYVIAHEVGHHVQNLMGVHEQVEQRRGRLSEAQANALSVRVELQADCFAGVWGHHANQARQILESGDVEEALNAASRIGDDALQRQARGEVMPESFTHGTSAQRVAWFRRGLESGRVKDCDTFQARQL